jgi:hypothetical protein
LHQGTQREAVAGADQVHGVAHQRDAHRASLQDQARQIVGMEVLQTRPQADVRRSGRLCLHADQVFDRLEGGQLSAT